MESIRLFKQHGGEEPHGVFRLEGCRSHKGTLILKLEGVDDISGGRTIKGHAD